MTTKSPTTDSVPMTNPKVRFHFITLFPEAIDVWLKTSILGRALAQGLFAYTLHQLRNFTHDRHRTVDDVAYGGGGGMVLKIEPLVEAVELIRKVEIGSDCRVIYFSPVGRRLDQALLSELTPVQQGEPAVFIFVCGHYEGVDQRFIDGWVDLEVSLGDFVVTGGELPAVALADAMVRRFEGALGRVAACENESFSLSDPKTRASLLEYPHYTRPAEFRGRKIPDVIASGNHEKVAAWRHDQSVARTRKYRPDLLGFDSRPDCD